MGLYFVPQSAALDANMIAAVARFYLRAPKPEAFQPIGGANNSAVIALHLEEAYDAVGSALGDYATLPLLQVDARLDGAAHKLAARSLMRERGYDREAGADATIETNGQEADAFLARCRPGGDGEGKTENPRFVDSGGNVPLDAPSLTNASGSPGGAARSDDFIRSRAETLGEDAWAT